MGKTVIFDVDGTLLNTEILYMEGWRRAGKEFGFHVTEEALLQTRAVNSAVAKEVFRRLVSPEFPYEAIRSRRVDISEEIIESLPPERLRMPYADILLPSLRREGFSIAAASSTVREKTVAHLTHAGLYAWFSAVVCGDMVTRGKPEPDIFLKAAALVGAVPEECIVVGDTPADVFAAHAAGMKMILIPDQVPANEKTIPLSWRILSGLAEVPAVIEQWQNA